MIQLLRRWFDPRMGARNSILARWIFLRALALIYLSAFYSLLFQIKGLIGPQGIEPAVIFLRAAARYYGPTRLWHVPSLFWISSSAAAMMTVTWIGIVASVLVFCNVWPRVSLFACWICFLSFVTAAGDFSSYQSDGMLLEAGFIALFFAPPGVWPGLAAEHPPSQISLWLLRWEWFRIYFESGVVKELSGDPQWHNFTAMDEYYQNGPLPTWIGWYVQHLPHWFHAATVYATLSMELGVVWMFILPRRWRIVCFFIVTPWEVGVILTANYTFLNYLVLALGVLLLDDRFVQRFVPARWITDEAVSTSANTQPADARSRREKLRRAWRSTQLAVSTFILCWIFYAATAEMLANYPLPTLPIIALQPFRIANRYGLFAVMTRGRYEIEFEGSYDGENWKAYQFRYKPQELNEPPSIYAPYQPRFDWNLWFASLGSWREYPIVPNTIVRLLSNDKDVLQLFTDNPFPQAPPREIRTVLWQYWFTSMEEKRKTGMWWKRQLLGRYAPTLEKAPDGEIRVLEWADVRPRE